MILVSTAVENHGSDSLGLGAFRHHLAHRYGDIDFRSGRTTLLVIGLMAGCGDQGMTFGVVDYLSKLRNTRSLGRSRVPETFFRTLA